MFNLSHVNVCVVGGGKSGISLIRFLWSKGAHITLFDENEKILEDERIISLTEKEGIYFNIITKEISDDEIDNIDIFVFSPGVPLDTYNSKRFISSDGDCIGEIELGYLFEKGDLFAITGTNGKTTTTSLVYHILNLYYEKAFLGGNIGIPYTDFIDKTSVNSATALEVSTFQLETINKFHPHISSILNITPDHLNRHNTMEKYISLKKDITKNQNIEDYCILNYEDDNLRIFGEELLENLKVNVSFFSSKRELESGAYKKDDNIIISDGYEEEILINIKETSLIGNHNYENIMAAALMCKKGGIDIETIRKGIRTFRPVEHRMEFVEEINGVKYYNDSKGTNTDASIKAIESFKDNVLLIGGGYDKKADYKDWVLAFKDKVKKLYLMGDTRENIKNAAIKEGFSIDKIEFVDSMREAVEKAKKESVKGDSVLLSPACASFGMYENYEKRGEDFKTLVREK